MQLSHASAMKMCLELYVAILIALPGALLGPVMRRGHQELPHVVCDARKAECVEGQRGSVHLPGLARGHADNLRTYDRPDEQSCGRVSSPAPVGTVATTTRTQDTRDLYYMMMATGRSQVGDTPGFNGHLDKALGSIKAKTLFIFSPRDELMLPAHIDAQAKMIPNARALAIERLKKEMKA